MYIIIKQICTDLQWHLDHLSKQTQQTAHRIFRFAEAQQHFGSQKVTSPEITPGQPGMTKNDQKSRRKPYKKEVIMVLLHLWPRKWKVIERQAATIYHDVSVTWSLMKLTSFEPNKCC